MLHEAIKERSMDSNEEIRVFALLHLEGQPTAEASKVHDLVQVGLGGLGLDLSLSIKLCHIDIY